MSALKHKSSQDLKNQRIANAVKKLGGQDKTDQVLAEWDIHRRSQSVNDRYTILICFLYYQSQLGKHTNN